MKTVCLSEIKWSFFKDYTTAEKLYAACGMFREAVEMYNEAGLWEKAHAIASQNLDLEDVSEMYVTRAEDLEEAGKYREAEKLYLSVNQPDLAIAMYKKVEQYDNMVNKSIYIDNFCIYCYFHLINNLIRASFLCISPILKSLCFI